MKSLTFFAHGLPVGQPRPRAVARGRHARVYDPGTANEWKACVIHAAREEMEREGWRTTCEAVALTLEFYMPRPKGHFGSGKNADQVRASAPKRPVGKPDLDNLTKAVKDALTSAGVWRDDSQVVASFQWKRFGSAGARVTITEAVE